MIGVTVSHYKVHERLGGGGMGVVYRAEDMKLGRQVALKFLPDELAKDPQALERFQREARAASALNHPHICTIYEIDEADGRPFIAMELLEGKTLDHFIGQKPLPTDQVLEFAIQIAGALEAAHSKGIIHRDIKPANTFVTTRGDAKLMDFGLAKLAQHQPSAATQVTSAGTENLTNPGSTVGTIAFMSPEQALGEELDTRTDLFSFGAVLYQMATGKQAFSGNTPAAVFDAILHRNPAPASGLNSGIPGKLDEIVGKALEKDRNLRYQNAGDLKADLMRLRRDSETAAATSPRAAPSKLALAILAASVAVAILIGFVITRDRPDQTSSFAGGTFTQLTNSAGPEFFPSITPDGESFVFAAAGDIFFQRVGGENPINLMKDEDPNTIDTQPAFSPDGRMIAFRSSKDGGGIFVMGATGESVKRLTNSGFNPAWSPDQKEIVYSTESITTNPLNRGTGARLWVVTVATGATRQLTQTDAVQPNWSPHGQRIAYWAIPEGGSQRDIWTIPAQGGKPVQVTNDAAVDWNPVWSPDGRYIYFSSDRAGTLNLWRIRVSEASGEPSGVAEAVTTPASLAAQMSFSRDGKRMLYIGGKSLSNVSRIEFDAAKGTVKGSPIPVTQGTKLFTLARPSPDGQLLTFASLGQEDIYISKADGTGMRNLTSDDFRDRVPRWAPDGKAILFYSDRSGGRYQIWSVNVDGSGLKQITESETNVLYPLVSADGSRLIFSDFEKASFMMRTDKGWKEQTIVTLPAIDNFGSYLLPADWSADGKWAAGTLRRPGFGAIPGIYIYSPESNAYRQLTSYGGGPLWLNDNRRILFLNGTKLGIVDIETKAVHDVEGVFAATGISRDNHWIYFQQNSVESDVWMLKQASQE